MGVSAGLAAEEVRWDPFRCRRGAFDRRIKRRLRDVIHVNVVRFSFVSIDSIFCATDDDDETFNNHVFGRDACDVQRR